MTERRRLWKMAAEGEAGLVVGARSALFLPFRDLGLIVVDEEHDTSYKQEDGVLYNARDMAVLRAAIAGCPVVLASATPSAWRPGRMSRRGSIGGWTWEPLRRGGTAGDAGDRHAGESCRGIAGFPRRWPRRSMRGRGASRRCCS
jgi:hypothetical protein